MAIYVLYTLTLVQVKFVLTVAYFPCQDGSRALVEGTMFLCLMFNMFFLSLLFRCWPSLQPF